MRTTRSYTYRTCKTALSSTTCSTHIGLARPLANLSTRSSPRPTRFVASTAPPWAAVSPVCRRWGRPSLWAWLSSLWLHSDFDTATQHRHPHTPPALAGLPQWRKRLKALAVLRHRCNQLPLSAMGRDLCFTAHGGSRKFYAAEFEGLPADSPFQREIRHAMADLVDGHTRHRLPRWNLASFMAHPVKEALASISYGACSSLPC
jgi:hypothetical protein